jgi:hypothetical protein
MQLIHQLPSLKEYYIATSNTGDHPWQHIFQPAHGLGIPMHARWVQ